MNVSFRLLLLLGLFVGMLIGMNLLGVKIISFFGISVTVGIFMYPITFLITDIVAEVYGKQMARKFLGVGLLVLTIIFAYTALFISLAPHERYVSNPAYVEVFGSSLRIIIASIIAFALSQFHDIWAFEFWKRKTKGKLLWLRNNLSTIVSQAIDTTVFIFIAFYQVSPQFDAAFVFSLIVPFYLFKIAFAILDTPFVYLGVRWLRKENVKS